MSLHAMERRLRDSELVQDIDDEGIAKQGIPCPVPWCAAHVHRYARCGDRDGDFEGLHRGRIAAVTTWPRTKAREVESFRAMGIPSPEMAVAVGQVATDAVNSDLVPGSTPEKRRYARTWARMTRDPTAEGEVRSAEPGGPGVEPPGGSAGGRAGGGAGFQAGKRDGG